MQENKLQILQKKAKLLHLKQKIQLLQNEKQNLNQNVEESKILKQKLIETQQKLSEIVQKNNDLRTSINQLFNQITQSKKNKKNKKKNNSRKSKPNYNNLFLQKIFRLQNGIKKLQESKNELNSLQNIDIEKKIENSVLILADLEKNIEHLNNDLIQKESVFQTDEEIFIPIREFYYLKKHHKTILLQRQLNQNRKQKIEPKNIAHNSTVNNLRYKIKQQTEKQKILLRSYTKNKAFDSIKETNTTSFTEEIEFLSSEFSENDLNGFDTTAEDLSSFILQNPDDVLSAKEVLEEENSNKNEQKPKLISLHDVLSSPIGIENFSEFLRQSWNQENIMFYLQVDKFRKNIDQDSLEIPAKGIYEKFIKPGSLFEINIDSKSRDQIINMIENNNFEIDMFNDAFETVFKHMEQDNFIQFRRSSLYSDFVEKISRGIRKLSTSELKFGQIIVNQKKEQFLNNYPVTTLDTSPIIFSEKIMEMVIDLLHAFYSPSTQQIDCELMSNSLPFRRFVHYASQLQNIKLDGLSKNEKITFFINIHNTLSFHISIIYGLPRGTEPTREYIQDITYLIGGHLFSLSDIKYGILFGNWKSKKKPYWKKGDSREKLSVLPPNLMSIFALSEFHIYSPPLRIFHYKNIEEELFEATKKYTSENWTILKRKKQILLAPIFTELFGYFRKNQQELLSWVSQFFPESKSYDYFSLQIRKVFSLSMIRFYQY
ncbi:electron carrier/ protein disulfide oxidoreductase [Anaeramoeba ignava]|uniref:Electron carrier/ protein disulfide oxidoreductase n=1 Tax=Anaeramoeba ignava TaxID=1746090 RepID=A0A9Q0RBL3_ANAIG|nr:electron carrier/ protein disulfide oxidoreductase [Anaeramoeba ignava]